MVSFDPSFVSQIGRLEVRLLLVKKLSRSVRSPFVGFVFVWLRYVDDTFTAIHKDEIDAFHDHLNEQNADIQFTKEIEENGKLPFLDCLLSRDNNELRTTVYRKPTHTDRLLDESSYNPTSHKATTIRTLTRRAQLVCDTPDSLRDENKYLERVFLKKTTTTLTLLDETFTDLLTLTQLTRT